MQMIQKEGLRAVIHKATEGTEFVDSLYATHRKLAQTVDLLWGAYHLGVAGDPVGQSKHFLDHAKPNGETLLSLDFEHNPQGDSTSLDEARQFVTQVRDATGKWPGLYRGS